MFGYGYLTYQAERPKARAEQRETDAQMGRLSAAFAQLVGPLAKPTRALRRPAGTDGQNRQPRLSPGRGQGRRYAA
jgi:hypothetical protein